MALFGSHWASRLLFLEGFEGFIVILKLLPVGFDLVELIVQHLLLEHRRLWLLARSLIEAAGL